MLCFSPEKMKIIIVIPLVSCIVAGLNEPKMSYKSIITNLDSKKDNDRVFESFPDKLNGKQNLGYYGIADSDVIEFHFSGANVELVTNVISNISIELVFETVNGTELTGIRTGITTITSNTTLTIMETELIAFPIPNTIEIAEDNEILETPITSITIIVKVASKDVYLEEIVTSTASTAGTLPMYIVQAKTTKAGTTINEICNPIDRSLQPAFFTYELQPTTTTCPWPTTICPSGTTITGTAKSSDFFTTSSTEFPTAQSTFTTLGLTTTLDTTKPTFYVTDTTNFCVTTFSSTTPGSQRVSTDEHITDMMSSSTNTVSTTSQRESNMSLSPSTNQQPYSWSNEPSDVSKGSTSTNSKPVTLVSLTTKPSSSKDLKSSSIKEQGTTYVASKPITSSLIFSTTENTNTARNTSAGTDTPKTSHKLWTVFSSLTSTVVSPKSSVPRETTTEDLVTTATPVHLTSSGFSSSLSPTAGGHCDTEYSCLNCTTARVCAPTPGGPGLREVTQFPCPYYAPWCDSRSGTCSRLRTPQCDLPVVGNFTCMRDGHFPDPYSCAHYYLCDNDLPLQYTCLYPLPYYSPVSQTCIDRSSDCVDYQSLCQDKSGLKVSVPRVHNLFLYCAHGTVQVVDRCVGAYRFHYEQQACVPECPGAGLFPRNDNCASYYRCSPGSLPDHYTMTNLTCSQGLAFSESAYDCVDRSLVPNCNNSYIS